MMLMPTGHTPWVVAALAFLAGFAAMRFFSMRNTHLGISWLIAGVAGAVLAFLLPEPATSNYQTDIDLRVSFLLMQVLAFIAWVGGTGAAALILQWRNDLEGSEHSSRRAG